MIAKMTSKNQITLPKGATLEIGPTEYFAVEVKDGKIILTPVRLRGADAVRTKLDALNITATEIDRAVKWGRRGAPMKRRKAGSRP